MFLALFLSFVSLSSAAAPSTNDERIMRILDKKIEVLQSQSEAHSTDEFLFLCDTLKIPCGEESFSGEIDIWPPSTFNTWRRESMTARAALDRIVRLQPRYQWQIAKGVLMLSPRAANKFGPLEKRIPNFRTDSNGFASIVALLADSAGIQYTGTVAAGRVRLSSGKRISLNAKNSSVRSILNSAVLANGSGMWEFRYASPSGKDRSNYLCVYE